MNPIPYNGDGGYLSKNDIIKGMAAEIEMLKKELNISNQMKFTYMDDCTKMLADYAHLKAEVERLTADNRFCKSQCEPNTRGYYLKLINQAYDESNEHYRLFVVERSKAGMAEDENARLKAEVERLNDAIMRGASIPDAKPTDE